MKRLITYIFVLGIIITACGRKEIDYSNNEKTEECDNQNNSLVENSSSESIGDSDDASIDNTFETDDNTSTQQESNNIKSIDLDTKDNEFSKAISEDLAEGCSRASFIVDLDVDGNNEAFVIEGYEDDPGIPDYDDSLKYWYVNRIYFVDEEYNTTLLEDYEGSYIATSQELVEGNSQSFISINGYIGVDGIGCVYSVSEDCIKNCTPKLNIYGQKKFISDTEIVWYEEAYRSFFDYEEGSILSDLNGSGRCKLPYHMYLRDGEYYLYDAKEVTYDEVNEMAQIDVSEDIYIYSPVYS